eukprot:3202718-Rhodomonas_salina.4
MSITKIHGESSKFFSPASTGVVSASSVPGLASRICFPPKLPFPNNPAEVLPCATARHSHHYHSIPVCCCTMRFPTKQVYKDKVIPEPTFFRFGKYQIAGEHGFPPLIRAGGIPSSICSGVGC